MALALLLRTNTDLQLIVICIKTLTMSFSGAIKAATAAKQLEAGVALPVAKPAAVAGPSVKSAAAKPAPYNPIKAAATKAAPLSMVAIQAALEEACASAVTDVSELLCCPITHVSASPAKIKYGTVHHLSFRSPPTPTNRKQLPESQLNIVYD